MRSADSICECGHPLDDHCEAGFNGECSSYEGFDDICPCLKFEIKAESEKK